MKQFIVDRHTTPNTPTLEQVPTEKIPVYDDLDAAEADLANLAENQIIATHDTGSELSAPVDTVQSGNMHAVTSNAVANECCRFPDYAHRITITGTSWVATEDCYIEMIQILDSSATAHPFTIDGNTVSNKDVQGTANVTIIAFSGYVKKGQTVSFEYLSYSNFCKVFPLI